MDGEKILARLKEKGWHKGQAEGPDGSECLFRAAYRATGLKDWPATSAALVAAAEELFPERVDAPIVCPDGYLLKGAGPQVNDHPDTAWEDIALIVKHAAHQDGDG